MLVKAKRDGRSIMVEVSRKSCPQKSCFWIGEDKGTFVQGRGYVRYHDKVRMVCMRRHLYGCPTASICRFCHSAFPEGEVCEKETCSRSENQ